VIDEMPEPVRERLVAGAFTGYHDRYHVLLAWAESIPSEYDGVEFDDVRCRSELVGNLPRSFRMQLPERLQNVL
jgi:hypothetical protein